jgi:hypothetical protein
MIFRAPTSCTILALWACASRIGVAKPVAVAGADMVAYSEITIVEKFTSVVTSSFVNGTWIQSFR